MNRDELTHLRLDKIIYATEATAVNLACLLVFWIGERYFVGASKDLLMLGAVGVGVLHTIFVLIGNLFRLLRIKKLEKDS